MRKRRGVEQRAKRVRHGVAEVGDVASELSSPPGHDEKGVLYQPARAGALRSGDIGRELSPDPQPGRGEISGAAHTAPARGHRDVQDAGRDAAGVEITQGARGMGNNDINGRNAGEAERGQGVAAFPAAAGAVPGDRDPDRLLDSVPWRGQVPSRWHRGGTKTGQGFGNGQWHQLADAAGNEVGHRLCRLEALPLV
ncbi:Protein of unknown function [Mycobacterium canettii CIPT 140070010]|nr:Protein of unknown function [Mycobacterium canettii CIPT 140070010]